MISQRVHTQLILVGDGIATTFTFDLSHIYGMEFPGTQVQSISTYYQNPFLLIDPSATPDSVTVDSTNPNQGPVTASISRRTITLTFATAPAASEFVASISLIFNG